MTLAVLALGGIAYAMLSSLVVPALPTMQRELGTTETGITWLLTAYLLAASVGTSIIGRLGDMYGKERLLLWTLLIADRRHPAGRGLELAAAADRRPLHPGRWPAASSRSPSGSSATSSRAEKVAGGIGLLSAILGVGGGVGIVLSGVIVEHLNYHWLFWIPLVAIVARRRRHLAPGPGIAGAHAGPRQLAGGGADDDRHLGGAAGDQPDHRAGAGSRARRSA